MSSALKKTVFSRRAAFTALGIAAMAVIWHVVSIFTHSIVLASPLDTVGSLISMLGNARFRSHLWMSFWRIFAGIAIGGFFGFFFGIASGLSKDFRYFIEPLRWTLMSIPAVIVIVIAMLWFGMGSAMVVFITSLMLSPIIYVNTVRGFDSVDDTLLEMTRLYRFSRRMTVRHVYVPALTAPLASAFAVAAGMGVRIVILAEVMGTSRGIGHAISMSRSNLEIPELFAWVLVCIAIVGFIEYALLKPVESHLMRWKS